MSVVRKDLVMASGDDNIDNDTNEHLSQFWYHVYRLFCIP